MLKDKKLFCFDIDGVIKLGNDLIDGALDLFNYINDIGGKSIFITNNSTKNGSGYVSFFRNLGFDVDESNFITALTVSVNYLKKHHKNHLIFVVGTKMLVEELKKNGLNVTEKIAPNIDVVLVGYDNELTYQKIADACEILQTQKVVYLATNLDLRCPMPYGFVPDCGAICNFIKEAVEKEPKFLGKPAPEMVKLSLELTGFTKDQTLVIGDRLYTDIDCGINAGVDTCAVLTGETTLDEINSRASAKPTYVFESVKELLQELKK